MPRRTTGRLEKRGKTWLAIWTHDGKRYAKSTGTEDRKEAERFLREQVGDFATANVQEQARRIAARALSDLPSPLLSSAWSLFEKAPNRSRCLPRSEQGLKHHITHFVEWVAKTHPSVETFRDVTDEIAVEYWNDLRTRLAPHTANASKHTLCRLWTIVHRNDPIALANNPWSKTKIANLPNAVHSRRELTVEELARVLSLVEGEMRTLFAIGIYTGLRLGDCARLDWSAVDLVRGFISLVPHKTARHGTHVRIPIAPTLKAILLETPASKRKGPVLPEMDATYRHCDVLLSYRIQRIFKKAGIETTVEGGKGRKAVQVGFHSLRHTFVSLSANAGVPLAVVQSIVGHTSSAMTAHYFHVSDSALNTAAASLPNVIDPKALPAPSASAKVEAIRKLLADLTPEEREQVRAML
jgi:integrase